MPSACILGQRRVQSTREEAGPAPCPPAGSAAQSSLVLPCVLPYPPDTGLCPGPAASSPNGEIQNSVSPLHQQPLGRKGQTPTQGCGRAAALLGTLCGQEKANTALHQQAWSVALPLWQVACLSWPSCLLQALPALSKRVTINQVTLRI